MNILVLGSTGFIGKNLVERLESNGHRVLVCSRSTGVDIRNYQQICKKIEEAKPDIIFNLASHGGSLHYVKEYAADVFADNVQMAINLYKAVKQLAPECKIINPFSNCSYPGSSAVQSEENWLSGPVHPSIFSFGNAKRADYYLSQCYYQQHGIKTVNILFPNTYGPGDSEDPNHTHALNGMVIRMLKAKEAGQKQFVVWGSGSPVREWAYVDDFISALERAMNIDHSVYPINFGQEKGYSIAESAKLIKEACDYEGEIVFDTTFPDGDAVKILGRAHFDKHFPNFSFFDHEEGIKRTVSYYQQKFKE